MTRKMPKSRRDVFGDMEGDGDFRMCGLGRNGV
jgi:hypothetical protein